MYIPKHNLVTEKAKQLQLIEEFPLGTLIYCEKGIFSAPVYSISHIPFIIKETPDGKTLLIAHMAKGNEQVALLKAARHEAVIMFRSADSYISPSWYPSKKETHKFVPTWDFATVNVFGTPKIIEDDRDWLLDMLNHITNQEEAKRPSGPEYEEKWELKQAPEKYVDAMLKRIVGIEIEITKMEGKFKLNQNMAPVDAKGVIDAHINEVGGQKGEYLAKMTTQEYPKELPQ